MTDEHLMIEIGEIEEILGGGERGEGGGTIIEERGSGSKMRAGEEGGTRGEEDKVQVGAGTGAEREAAERDTRRTQEISDTTSAEKGRGDNQEEG